MTDNIVTSKDATGSGDKPVAKKAATKKAAAKPKISKETEDVSTEDKPKKTQKKTNGLNIIVFESGSSYVSGDRRFTKENRIQEVSDEEFAFLTTLDNFRIADPHEIEEYLASRED